MMATAVLDNLVARNPCVEKGAGVERATEMSIATPEQVAVIAATVEPRYRALVLAAAYAGCRWGELVGLRRKKLDLARGTLTVVEQVVELRGGQLLTREPKSASGRRVVHLPAKRSSRVTWPNSSDPVKTRSSFRAGPAACSARATSGTATGFRRCGSRSRQVAFP